MLNTPFPNLHNKLPAMLCTLTLFTLAAALCLSGTAGHLKAATRLAPKNVLEEMPLESYKHAYKVVVNKTVSKMGWRQLSAHKKVRENHG